MISQVDNSAQKTKKTTKFARLANPFLKAFGRPPLRLRVECQMGLVCYCVGDIHGRDDLLRELAERVEADMKSRSFDHAVTVFLGDYVDRGRRSMRVKSRRCTVTHLQSPQKFVPIESELTLPPMRPAD